LAWSAIPELISIEVLRDPKASGKTYTTTSFEMARIENGKVDGHCNSVVNE